MVRGHRLNTSTVLAAVHGLSGLFRPVSAVEALLYVLIICVLFLGVLIICALSLNVLIICAIDFVNQTEKREKQEHHNLCVPNISIRLAFPRGLSFNICM